MTLFKFIDNLTGKGIALLSTSEDDAWANLCNQFGTGYVFENVERI